jgi:hypothetical protein
MHCVDTHRDPTFALHQGLQLADAPDSDEQAIVLGATLQRLAQSA